MAGFHLFGGTQPRHYWPVLNRTVGTKYARPHVLFTNDPRHQKLVSVLIPLWQRACPADGGGYGGAYELRHSPGEVEDLGGMPLIRSAMRQAARKLSWSKLQTYGSVSATVALSGVLDQREVPEEFAAAVERYKMAQMRDASEAVSKRIATGTPTLPAARCS